MLQYLKLLTNIPRLVSTTTHGQMKVYLCLHMLPRKWLGHEPYYVAMMLCWNIDLTCWFYCDMLFRAL